MIKTPSLKKIDSIYTKIKNYGLIETVSKNEVLKIYTFGQLYKNDEKYASYIEKHNEGIRIISTTHFVKNEASFLKNAQLDMTKFSRLGLFEKTKSPEGKNINFYKPSELFYKFF